MRKSTAILSVVVAVLAVALVTSIVAQSRPADVALHTPRPTSSDWQRHTVAATGYTPATFPVPRGAHSMTLNIVCTTGGRVGSAASGGIGIDVEQQRGRFVGCDDGEHSFAFPVTYSPGGLTIQISADDRTRFTMSASFSTEKAGPDPGTTIQCKAVSKTFSTVYLAESDYTHHRSTRAQWAAGLRAASIEALGIRPENTMLDSQVVVLQDTLTDSSVKPGELYDGLIGHLHPTRPDWAAAVNLTEQVCDYNGTGVEILGG